MEWLGLTMGCTGQNLTANQNQQVYSKNIPMYEISGISLAILEKCHYCRLPQPVQISSALELFMKEEILKLITEEVLDQQLKARNKIRQYGMPDKEFGFELKIKHFLKLMFVHFTSQSYGARIENRLSKEYNLTKVPSSKYESKGWKSLVANFLCKNLIKKLSQV